MDAPGPTPTIVPNLQEAIRKRAEEIYLRNGSVPGRDLENWAQAEQEIMRELSERPRKTAIIVRVNGTEYTGEYNLANADGYRPGEFGRGEPVPVRFHGDKMFIRRPNGKELETTIVKKTS